MKNEVSTLRTINENQTAAIQKNSRLVFALLPIHDHAQAIMNRSGTVMDRMIKSSLTPKRYTQQFGGQE